MDEFINKKGQVQLSNCLMGNRLPYHLIVVPKCKNEHLLKK